MKQEILRLSKSKINMFLECPRQYEFHYIKKLPGIDSLPLIRGRTIHAIISTYTLHCCKEKVRTDVESIKTIIPTIMVGMRTPRILHKEITEVVYEYISSHPVIYERIVSGSVETMAEMSIGKNLIVRGVPDQWEIERSTGTIIITDYKTGYRIMTKEEVQSDLSLIVYALLAIKNYYPEANHIVKRMDFVRLNHIVETECYAADLQEGIEYIKAVANAINIATKKNEFKATPGAACENCSYALNCTYKMTSVDKIEEFAGNVLVKDRQLTMDIDTLKEHVDKNGPIEVNGIVYKYYEKERKNWNYPGLIEWLQDHDFDVQEFLSNTRRFDKYREELIEKKLLTITKHSEFAGRKSKEYIGIELSKKYCEMSEDRINKTKVQTNLF